MASFREQFPPPWTVARLPGGYQVSDARGFVLLRVYAFSDEHLRLLGRADRLSWPQAYALAKAVAALGGRA